MKKYLISSKLLIWLMEKMKEKQRISEKMKDFSKRQELKRLSFFSINYIDRMDSCWIMRQGKQQ